MYDDASVEDAKLPQDTVANTSSELPKTTTDKHGNITVLVPQPTDDPRDPLVRPRRKAVGPYS